MSYAVVLNPPKKLPAPREKFAAKMAELGALYRQVKSGDVPKWQQFVKSAIQGAKFNPSGAQIVSFIGSGAVFGASNWFALGLIEKKIRIEQWKNWVMNPQYTDKPQEIMKNYYGKQMTYTLGIGAINTLSGFAIARYAFKGKIINQWGILLGGAVSTGIKYLSRRADLKHCWNYNTLHLAQKEAKKWAISDDNYFGKEFADKVMALKKLPENSTAYGVQGGMTGSVSNGSGQGSAGAAAAATPDVAQNVTITNSENVGGYIDQNVGGYIEYPHVGSYIQGW